MSYYFEDLEKQKKLKTILDSWVGTPYRHHTCVKQLGCDCIHFVIGVFKEFGIVKIDLKKIPDYPRDWHLHNTREMLSDGIEIMDHGVKVEKVDINNPMNGDVILSHYGKASSHAAIYFDDNIYQSIDGVGVCKISFSDKVFRKQMKFAYRIL
jgi:cell wall-associated NlpC family hydrolase